MNIATRSLVTGQRERTSHALTPIDEFAVSVPVVTLLLFALGANTPALILTVFWVLALLRILRATLLLGGLAGLAAHFGRR